jgi:allantoinase
MLIVRGRRIVLDGAERPASLHVVDGRVAAVRGIEDVPAPEPAVELVDAGDLVVSPGIVDSHVHVNEPGRTEWEGFDTATRAAAAGGVTTIVDMPLNSVPATIDVSALLEKRSAARGQCHVDVGFWGGIVPGNVSDDPNRLRHVFEDDSVLEVLSDAGVLGFKCFLVPSGVDEFPPVTEAQLYQAMSVLRRRELPLLVHAESPEDILPFAGQPASYRDYLATRPAVAEVQAIGMMGRLMARTGAHVHIVHVSSADGLKTITVLQTMGARITAETCPHYLTFSASSIPDGATEYKCAPPIRDEDDREALWVGLRSGALKMVASDHSPAPPALKCPGDFVRAWGGIASIELGLAAVWTEARVRGFGVADLARWMSEAPAALAGLSGRKGRIAPGYDADLVIWDPDDEFTVDASRLQQRHKLTPYAGRRLQGAVLSTFVRGQRVWDRGALVQPRAGVLL